MEKSKDLFPQKREEVSNRELTCRSCVLLVAGINKHLQEIAPGVTMNARVYRAEEEIRRIKSKYE